MGKVLINTIPLLNPITGIGRYIWEICSRLEGAYFPDSSLEHIYYYGFLSKKLTRQEAVNINHIIPPIVKKYIKKAIYKLSNCFLSKTFDVYWEPNNIPLNIFSAKHIITTLHDLSVFLYPQWHPKDRVNFFIQNQQNIYESDIIITVSNYIKKEIMTHLGIKEDKIKVIHLGYDNKFKRIQPATSLPHLKGNFKLNYKFILFVGSIEPRKNLKNVILSYLNLAPKYQKEYKLLIAGFKGWENKEIMELINKNNNIKYLGYVSDDMLVYLYNQATIFVYPSLYEGFGLPPIEAMACGCPVITSNKASLPEVCGPAAYYINPQNIENITESIIDLLDNTQLRQRLIHLGFAQIKKFSWEKCTQKHFQLFKQLCLK